MAMIDACMPLKQPGSRASPFVFSQPDMEAGKTFWVFYKVYRTVTHIYGNDSFLVSSRHWNVWW